MLWYGMEWYCIEVCRVREGHIGVVVGWCGVVKGAPGVIDGIPGVVESFPGANKMSGNFGFK
jgi:hypothetical protein